MAEGRQAETWQHTAWLAAMIANANRDPKRRPRPFTPDDFNPMVFARGRERKGATVVVTRENMDELRHAFAGMGRRNQ